MPGQAIVLGDGEVVLRHVGGRVVFRAVDDTRLQRAVDLARPIEMPLPPIAFMVSTNSGLPIIRIFWPLRSAGTWTGFLVYRLRVPLSIQPRPTSFAGTR